MPLRLIDNVGVISPLQQGKSLQMKFAISIFLGAAVIAISTPVMAGTVPMPVAGVFGPVGLAAAAVAYGGYRAVKYLRGRG